MPRQFRFILVAMGLSILLVGLWGGLLRLGSPLPGWLAMAVPHHGVLMIGGFLGAVITLERAVALGRWWCYLGPALAGAGAWTIAAGGPVLVGAGMITLASVVLVVDFGVILRRQLTAFTVVMGLGAAAWLVGNVLWLWGWAVPALVPWWSGFLILTIVGERLELSRFVPARPGRQVTFLLAAGVYGLGLVAGLAMAGLGGLIMGLGLVALAVWLAHYDVARQTIRQRGLTRFIATALLSGYGWLALGGGLMMYFAVTTGGGGGGSWVMTVPMAGPEYDAIWHCLLLGFVFAMIFGHAPIIVPAVMGVQVRYTRLFYGHLMLLHVTLGMRVMGDLLGLGLFRDWGGIGNVGAVLLFLGVMISSVRRRGHGVVPAVTAPAEVVEEPGAPVVQLQRSPRGVEIRA